MKRIVKLLIFGVIVIAIAASYFYSINVALIVPLSLITPKTAELSFSEQGELVAENVVQVYPLASGRLMEIKVSEDQFIAAGDIICIIDTEPLRLRITQIQSDIKAYRAQIDNLDNEQQKIKDELLINRNSLLGELAALEAQEKNSDISLESQNISLEEKIRLQNIIIEQNQKNLDRANEELMTTESLYNGGIISKSDYDAALDAVANCETQLNASRQELTIIEGGVVQSDKDYYAGMKTSLNAQIAGINQSLNKNYTYAMADYYNALIQSSEINIKQLENDILNCTVVATVDGTITKLNIKNTNIVNNTIPVAEITQHNKNVIEVYVSTKDIDSIKIGDTVTLTLKRREEDVIFTGELTYIDDHAEIKYTALGVEERKVKVKIDPNINELNNATLGIGYNVDVKFNTYHEENQLLVPKTALFQENDRDMIWVLGDDNKAYPVEVTKGVELRTEVVILSGLVEGNYVINDANNKDLKNGVKIKSE